MSLELQEPKFDRSFEELYLELRERIPRYNPKWTNFNDSDPGITLLQLFSWLGEMTLFRMGQVPRKNYMKFAQLMGLELLQAKAATVALVFTPDGTITSAVPAGSQYSAPGQAAPTIFETVKDLDVIGSVLADMVVFADGAPSVIPPPAPGALKTFYPFGRFPEIGNAIYLGFKPSDNQRPFPRRMSFLALRPTVDTRGAPVRAGAPDGGLVSPVDLVWEFRPKAGDPVWERLNLLDDTSVAFTRDGYIQVEGPAAIEAVKEPALTGLVDEERYWIRVRLDQGSYLKAPRLEFLGPNAVDAVNLVTEPERIMGISAGRAGQSFELPERPVHGESLRIVIRSVSTADAESEPGAGAGAEDAWSRVDDFFASAADSRDFLLDPSSGRITFGDGEHGAIPTAGAEIVAKVWRHGGGAAGNSAMPGSVTTMITQVAGIESVTNPRAAAGGGEEETIDAFLVRAPGELRRHGRAVTAEDFKALATTIDGVVKARAIAGRHPDYPDIEVPGSLTVVIVPDTDEKPPRPSAELIRAVCRFLDGYRLITTEVYVASPRFLEVRIEARLFADPTASFDTVAIEAKRRLEKFLDPRAREFGVDVSLAEIYRELLGTRAENTKVRSVEDLLVYVDGVPHEIKGPIEVPSDALVYSGEHLIVVRPDTDEGSQS